MADEATPEDVPAEDATSEEVAPEITAESMKADAAKLSLVGLKDQFDADKARMVELSELPAEKKNGETAAEMRMLAERTAIFKQAHADLKALDEIADPGDIDTKAEDAPKEDEPKSEDAPKAEDAPKDDAAPEDAPKADAEPELVDVNANAGGGAGGSTLPVANDSKDIKRPWVMASTNGAQITDLATLGQALLDQAGRNDQTWVGSFAPYGSNVTAGVLGSDPNENFRTIFGDDTRQMHELVDRVTGKKDVAPERTSFTAALNCKGPAEVVEEIPFCYSQGRPLTDSGLISQFEAVNGQIQLYGCRDLPDFATGAFLNATAVDCEDCDASPTLTCAQHVCITPEAPMEPEALITCMCIPESLRFSHPLLLERALEEFAIANDVAYENRWLTQLRDMSLVRTINGADEPEHGAHNTIGRALIALASRLAINPRENCGGLASYSAFVPGGEAMFLAAQRDWWSRVYSRDDMPGETILEHVESIVGNITFGLDQDPGGPQAAEGYVETYLSEATGNAGAIPLEGTVDAGSIYLIPRDSIGTASPLRTEFGLDDREKSEVAGGCLKLIRREWWFDLFQIGCRKPIVLDFTNLGMCGTGPDLSACS